MNAHYRELSPSPFGFQMRIPPLARYARSARAALRAFARYQQIAPRDVEYLTFALGEALSNAIVHSKANEDISIAFAADESSIVVTVCDRGEGLAKVPFDPELLEAGSSETGRGFIIMERCTDFFDVHSAPGKGTVVTLGRYRHR
jgi:stage II sporulation protein AB (anti-sigma F factor)